MIEAEGEAIDEDTPMTLSELSERTSMPVAMLAEMESALLAKGQLVLVGPPGTSKTWLAQEFARYFVRGVAERPQGPPPKVIYMHANWTYEDFFVGVRPRLHVDSLSFERCPGALLKWIADTPRIHGGDGRRAVVILDELNRCDTAAVFGELLQLLEYRGRTVQLMNDELFVLPRSLYVIGTMNSADRSVGRMDLALRRRFYFFQLLSDAGVLDRWLAAEPDRNPARFKASALAQCNEQLQKECGVLPEQQVGHALFMTAVDGQGADGLTSARIRQVVVHSIIPYVRELVLERGRDPDVAIGIVRASFQEWTGPIG